MFTRRFQTTLEKSMRAIGGTSKPPSSPAMALLKTLFAFDLFPVKDSNVAYLRRDGCVIARNPGGRAPCRPAL
jgi:hypothetical protein